MEHINRADASEHMGRDRSAAGGLERPWNAKTVADYLGYSLRHTYTLTRDGVIPATKRGNRWYYDPRKIHAWILG